MKIVGFSVLLGVILAVITLVTTGPDMPESTATAEMMPPSGPMMQGGTNAPSVEPNAASRGPAEPVVSGEVSLKPEFTAKAKGIRTLYVIVYDAKSAMPMPYGAYKMDLTADAKGTFSTFAITTANLTVMNSESPMPSVLRLKFRLDKDGSAGKDAPGDIVGNVPSVQLGSKEVKVMLDQAM